MGKKIIKNVLIFIVIFLAINLIFNAFGGDKKTSNENFDKNEIGINIDSQISQIKTITVELKNNTKNTVSIKNECPRQPLNVFKFINNEWKKIEAEPKIDCSNAKDFIIEADKTITIAYDKWNHALFGELGKYKISLTTQINEKDKIFESSEFEIVPQGIFRKIWNDVFYQPIYNALIFLVSIMPAKNLGLGIILLTIIIRFILFIPSHQAMKSQKRMQEIQPEIDRIKEKHKGDQQTIGQETMRIFKENKVNPFGSCLPILIQFPFLIAIFYVIQDGLNVDNAFRLYGPLKNFSLENINIVFLGILDLTKQNAFALPIIIGGLQFLQMKLSFVKKDKIPGAKSESKTINNAMLYFMPVMIAIFTASVPAGVGLYWGISTIFSIGQQLVINKKKDEEKEPSVKVVYK